MNFGEALSEVLMHIPLLRNLLASIALSILVEAFFGDWK